MLAYLLKQMEDCYYVHENQSCDEVAERLLDKLGMGYLKTFHGEHHIPGNSLTGELFRIPTDEGLLEIVYHTVVCVDGKYILDPLLREEFGGVIDYAGYLELLKELNRDTILRQYDGEVNY